MPSAHDRQTLARRTVLSALLLAPLAGCGLRLENDAPLPGPKAGPAPDVQPLMTVRTWLVAAMSAAQSESWHHGQAVSAMAVHRPQLSRLDATLEGLGAKNLPIVTATGDPTAPSPSASSAPSTTTSPATASPSTPSASPSSRSGPSGAPTGSSTAWTRAESIWATMPAAQVITRLSSSTRPLVMSLAAASLASLTPAHIAPRWAPDMAMPTTDGTLLAALESAIDALEWVAARTETTARSEVASQLHWAYAARSVTEAAMPVGASGKRLPWRTFTSPTQARDVARKAALSATSAAADVVKSARTARETAGMLYVWSGAWSLATQLGEDMRPFPGLAV